MFVTSLAVFLALMVQYPSFRKYAPLLILLGFIEIVFSLGTFIEGFFIGLATAFVGFLIPAAYALKPRLSKNQFMLLTFSGCLELAMGTGILYYRILVGAEILMVLLVAAGSCSLTIGIASFFIAQPKKPSTAPKDYRRNLAVIALIIVVSIAFLLQYNSVTKSATVNYTLDINVSTYYPAENNAINITCSNSGDKGANFYLVLNMANASFSPQTEQPYLQVNSTTVKFPFTLHNGDSTVKPVFFSIDDNATGFSFNLSFEKVDQNTVYGQSLWYYVSYEWNETGGYYGLSEMGGTVASQN